MKGLIALAIAASDESERDRSRKSMPMLQSRIKNIAASGIAGNNIRFFKRDSPFDGGLEPLTFVSKLPASPNPPLFSWTRSRP